MNKITHRFVAVGFREDFDVKDLSNAWTVGSRVTDPRDYRVKDLGDGKMVFAFSFGALTFLNMESQEREREIQGVKNLIPSGLTEKAGTEEFLVEEILGTKPHVEGPHLVVDKLSAQRAEVIALTLAQSAAMEYYEGRVVDIWNRVSVLVQKLENSGNVAYGPSKFHKLIGAAMVMRSEVVGVLHLLDRPDLIWDDQQMDAVYTDLRTMFDLGERFQALEYKIDMIQDALELLVDIARDRRMYLAELIIIVLIGFEILWALGRAYN